MKKTLFVFVVVACFAIGCVSGTDIRSTTEQVTVSPEPVTASSAANPEAGVWFLLDDSSNLLVAHTHTVNSVAEQIGIADNSDWRIVNRAWGVAVNGWLYGVERLRRTADDRERLGALLALEDDLLELESSLRDLEVAAASAATEDDGLELALDFLGVAVRQARDAVTMASVEFIGLTD